MATSSGEIIQPVELDGCHADAVVLFSETEIDQEKLAESLPARVDFRRGVRNRTVYLEGNFDSEQLMALFLALNEDV